MTTPHKSLSESETKTALSLLPESFPSDPTASFKPEQTLVQSLMAPPAGHPLVDTFRVPDSQLPAPRWSVSRGVGGAAPARGDAAIPSFGLNKLIGMGGFGEVWEARQHALDRIIAVKRLREDRYRDVADNPASTNQFNILFRQEALTTARLEHPNIIPIHDLGTDEEGRPILAMKLVRGKPWSELLFEDATLPMEEYLARHLAILIDMAQAVAFAHARGIIHRDLKPSQVMVGEFGEVLLMDWGLAVIHDEVKAGLDKEGAIQFAPTLAEATNPSGTAALMAPEQTHHNASRVGPWTDVYLLGGTLYYVLTLTFPHRAESAREAFIQAMLGDVEPPEQRAPRRGIPRELSELCARALDPEIGSRMGSATEFLDALRDFLSGSSRRRESLATSAEVAALREAQERPTYRDLNDWDNQLVRALGLWSGNSEAAALRQQVLEDHALLALTHGDLQLARVQAERLESPELRERIMCDVDRADYCAERIRRQRRVLLRAAALMLLAIGVLGVHAYRRSIVAAEAQLAAEQSAVLATRAMRAAENQRDLADGSRRRAEGLMNFMLGDLYSGLGPLNRLDLLGDVAQASLNYFSSFSGELDTQARLQRARALLNIAEVLQSEGRLAEAREAVDIAGAIARELVDADPTDDERRFLLAQVMSLSARLHENGGNPAATLADAARVRDLLAENPQGNEFSGRWQDLRAEAMMTAARAHHAAGDLQSSIEECRRAVAILEERHAVGAGGTEAAMNLAVALGRLADFTEDSGDMAGAASLFERAHGLLAPLQARGALPPRGVSNYAQISSSWAGNQYTTGNIGGAVQTAEAGLRAFEPVAGADPRNLSQQEFLGQLYLSSAKYLEHSGRMQEALLYLEAATDIWDRLLAEQPENAEWLFNYARLRDSMSSIKAAQGEWEQALEHALNVLETRRRLVELSPGNAHYERFLSGALSGTGMLLETLGQREEALAMVEEALAIRRKLAAANAASSEWTRDVAVTLNNLGILHKNAGRMGDARAAYLEAAGILGQLSAADPANTILLADVAMMKNNVADAALQLGDAEEAVTVWLESAEEVEALINRDPANAQWQVLRGRVHLNIGEAQQQLGEHGPAIEHLAAACAMLGDLMAQDTANADLRGHLARGLGYLARSHWYLEDFPAAVSARRESLSHARVLVSQSPAGPFENYLFHDSLYMTGTYILFQEHAPGSELPAEAEALFAESLAGSLKLRALEYPLDEIGTEYAGKAALRLAALLTDRSDWEGAFAHLETAVECGVPAEAFAEREELAALREHDTARFEELAARAAQSTSE